MSLASDGPDASTGSPGPVVVAAPDTVTGSDIAPTVVPASAPSARRPAVVDVRAGDIPWAALQAYKRSADVLGEVEESCGVTWTLLAAVGQVSSRHGQAGKSELGDDGVARPDVVAAPATSRRTKLGDTDGGTWDGDPTQDRAVGPMQLLPAMWDLAAVDGDGDGDRSPHDLDDAALATAVFLCASGSDLTTRTGAAEALRLLDGSPVYVEQVLAVEKAYRDGDFAVAGPPAVSTIGKFLSTGASRPARIESARAVEKVAAAQKAADRKDARRPVSTVTRTPVDDPAPPAAEKPSPKPATQPIEAPTEPSAPAGEPAEDPTTAPPAAEEPAAEEPAVEEPPAEEPPAEEPPAEEPPAEEPPAEEPPAEEPAPVVATGVWTACETDWCMETADGVLVPLDLSLLGKNDEELAAMEGQEVRLLVVEGTEPLQVLEILPPDEG
ncbi:MAG TPA: hypothetical protein VFZ64_13475 [Nocardioidaceae bacterium]